MNHTIVDSREKLVALVKYELDNNFNCVTLDVETDSTCEKIAKLYGIGLCFDDEKAFYIVWRDKLGKEIWSEDQKKYIISWVKTQASNKKLIGHNIIYDVLVLKNTLNIDLTHDIYSDTILQKHTLDEEPPFALKEISVNILGSWADKAQEKLKDNVIANGGKFTKNSKDMYLADTEILGEYCCWDVILTYKLFKIFEKRLEGEELKKFFYEEEVMELYKWCTIPMKDQGFPIDVEYFKALKEEMEEAIYELEARIMLEIKEEIDPFERSLLEEKFPIKPTGNFPKYVAEVADIPLPLNKTGKITLSKTAIQKIKAASKNKIHVNFYDWLLGHKESVSSEDFSELDKLLYEVIDDECIHKARLKMFKEKNPNQTYVFNLKSNDHLSHWLFNIKYYSPAGKTETGKNKVDMKFLETLKDHEPAVAMLLDLKKLNKLLSTYVIGILNSAVEGKIYTSLQQFGTTSGRYSSTNPNLQNLPRPREKGFSEIVLKYTNAIRAGFKAPKGYKILDADYASLEPRCFAHVCGDSKLVSVFTGGEDLYSRIAIDVFDLKGVSANPSDENYLGSVDKEKRQTAKVFTLAVPYGAEAARIAEAMKVNFITANNIITKYLDSYPGLKKFMFRSNFQAKKYGKITTEFGRVRHLNAAKMFYHLYDDDLLDWNWASRKGMTKERREFKNLLNNAKNFQIQGLAAHIMNRAMIAIAKEFKNKAIDGHLTLQVHDQCIAIVNEKDVDTAKKIFKSCMENTTKLSLPLIADPQVADNLRDSH